MARHYNWRSIMTTHQPVLFAVAELCDGPIAEFGCGHGSTPFLHELAERRGLRLLSLETDPVWLERFRYLTSERHEFRLVEDWEAELERSEWSNHWGLVFVDQDIWDARASTVKRVSQSADYVILHDCDAAPNHGLGRTIRALNGPRDRGSRDFGDVFSSWREFFPPEPWPHKHAGPPTLLASNRFDVHVIDVRYERHLPLWWRVGRHLRGFVPQAVRMRVGNLIGWRRRPRLQ